MHRLRFILPIVGILSFVILSFPACNDSSANGKTPPVVATKASTAASDPFALPEGANSEQLFKFIDGLNGYRPRSAEEAQLYMDKAPGAIAEAATQIMAMEPDKASENHIRAACVAADIRIGNIEKSDKADRRQTTDQVMKIISSAAESSSEEAAFHIDRLMYLITELRSAGEIEMAADSLRDVADIYLKTEDSNLVEVAKQLKINAQLISIPILPEDKQRQILKDLETRVKEATPQEIKETHLATMRLLIQELEEADNADLARTAYRSFATILSQTKDEELNQIVEYFTTMSQPIDLAGTTYDGKAFDADALRGKVVLVNFWATWCTPCLKKLPELEEVYNKYHDRGFEIVGVSLDENKSALDSYMSTKGMPWTVLHHPGGQHPLAIKYYVEAIPETLLVDQQGYIVARGLSVAELTDKLDELLKK